MSEEAVVEATEAVAPVETPEAAPEPDKYESDAKKYGWAPIEDWHGDPDKHISAEKYMTRGAGALKKLEAEKSALEKRVEQVESTITTRVERMERAQKAAHEAQLREKLAAIETIKRKAVETGDTKSYEAAAKREKDLQAPAEPQEKTLAPDDQQAVTGWLDAHPDYRTNAEYQGEINSLWAKAEQYGIKDVKSILKFIDDNYKPAAKPVPPGVEGGGATRGTSKRGRWAEIPAEDRKQAEKFIADGTFDVIAKEKGMTPQEAYAQLYFEG